MSTPVFNEQLSKTQTDELIGQARKAAESHNN